MRSFNELQKNELVYVNGIGIELAGELRKTIDTDRFFVVAMAFGRKPFFYSFKDICRQWKAHPESRHLQILVEEYVKTTRYFADISRRMRKIAA